MASYPDDLTVGPPAAVRTPASTPFTPGAIIASRYRLVALLGRRGMGEVYRADDLTLDHPVALKFLPEGAAGSDSLAQFHRELRIARQVSHKFFVSLVFFVSFVLIQRRGLARAVGCAFHGSSGHGCFG